MIEITHGFTSICAGSDPIPSGTGVHRPTGARVTVDFCRETALPVGQAVRAHYEFAGDGKLRTATGIAMPTRVAVHWGRPVVFHYRLSQWIEPGALMRFAERLPDELPTRNAFEPRGFAPAGDRIPA